MRIKRDFGAEILDLDGRPVRAGASVNGFMNAIGKIWPDLTAEQKDKFQKVLDEETGKPLTLGRAAADALTEPLRGEENLEGSEKVARFGLALMVNGPGVVEINTEQRDKIKACVNKRFAGALIVGRVFELMEKEVPQPEAALPE